MELVVGLDIGTTAVKAVLFQRDGTVLAIAEKLVTTYYPEPGWAEQDPVEVESKALEALRDVIQHSAVKRESIKAIGISCAMHSLICVNETGIALSNALIWSDGRAKMQADALSKKEIGARLYDKTGVPIHPMSPLVKLIWMKETGFNAYKQASHFISLKEYILFHWFGERMIDYAMASATGLFNKDTLSWEQEALVLAGITEAQLSNVVAPTEVLNGIRVEVAEKIGIQKETPFVIGAADGQLANLGIGAILPGEVAITVGTSGAVRQLVKDSRLSKQQGTFCYAFTEQYKIVGGPTNNGGIVVQWLKEVLHNEDEMEDFLKKAETVNVGADGLFFIPYINGERAPIWNQNATGSFYGLKITHTQNFIIRAVLEGITLNLYEIYQDVKQIAGEPERIFVNGGLARSKTWLQLVADIFGKEVCIAESPQSSAWGAAWIALVGIGVEHTLEAIKDSIHIEKVIKPNVENHSKYKRIYEEWKKLIPK
ncbi:gluconokinase [Lederbergia graminis]|uniref:Gluconokinase n=1 Tax=Lederbergia graminis TaxID=735518 RepID=A0ABW0LNI4_9BACI